MTDRKNSLTYADAGVDIDAGNRLVDLIKPLVRAMMLAIQTPTPFEPQRLPGACVATCRAAIGSKSSDFLFS